MFESSRVFDITGVDGDSLSEGVELVFVDVDSIKPVFDERGDVVGDVDERRVMIEHDGHDGVTESDTTEVRTRGARNERQRGDEEER